MNDFLKVLIGRSIQTKTARRTDMFGLIFERQSEKNSNVQTFRSAIFKLRTPWHGTLATDFKDLSEQKKNVELKTEAKILKEGRSVSIMKCDVAEVYHD